MRNQVRAGQGTVGTDSTPSLTSSEKMGTPYQRVPWPEAADRNGSDSPHVGGYLLERVARKHLHNFNRTQSSS